MRNYPALSSGGAAYTPRSGEALRLDDSVVDPLGQAVRAIEAFAAAGVTSFMIQFHDDTTARHEAFMADARTMRERMPEWLARNATGRESLMVRMNDVQLIQVDDCNEELSRRLSPYTFLVAMTSPGSYQAWLCVEDAVRDASVRERLLAHLTSTPGNGGAYGGIRWPGSLNCKRTRRHADGSFPMVTLVSCTPGRRVSTAELERHGLLAPPRRRAAPRWRHAALHAAHGAGLTRAAAWAQRTSVLILGYEGVTGAPEFDNARLRQFHVRERVFAEQLAHLADRYRVIALSEYLASLRDGRPVAPRSVVLTFQEGYRNFLTVAAPWLRALDLPATVFIVPERVRAERVPLPEHWTPLDDEVDMSWRELAQLQTQGVEVGLALRRRPFGEAAGDAAGVSQELRASRMAFAAHVDVASPTLALRTAEWSPEIVAVARALDIGAVVRTGDVGLNPRDADPFALRRTYARQPGDDELPAFAAHVSGMKRWWWHLAGRERIEA